MASSSFIMGNTTTDYLLCYDFESATLELDSLSFIAFLLLGDYPYDCYDCYDALDSCSFKISSCLALL